jgi:hypothetical protein
VCAIVLQASPLIPSWAKASLLAQVYFRAATRVTVITADGTEYIISD